MIHRQKVNVYAPFKEASKKTVEVVGSYVLPGVYEAGIRTDIVNFVHTNINKNKRQGQAINYRAGMKHSAQSWGTGRAVSRIPRVGGSGTSRSGQGAFGNMCRKGRMFGPLRIWRRWHRRTNIRQKRYAVASALAASAILPLVQARGHRVEQVPELPLVISDAVEKIERTKEAVRFLKDVGAYADVKKVADTQKIRAGRGKARNRRFRTRRGPLVVYNGPNVPLLRALRNVPGVEVAHVSRLNLLQLAPGGHVGRFIIWVESAFKSLNKIFGTLNTESQQKKGYKIPHTEVTNPDLSRVINSQEIQTAIKPKNTNRLNRSHQKINPLKNKKLMDKLNPNAGLVRKAAREATVKGAAARAAKKGLTPAEKKTRKIRRVASKKWINNTNGYLEKIFQKSKAEEIATKKLERQIE